MMKTSIVSAALLALVPFAVSAEPRSANDYTFVEGGYQYVDGEFTHADGAYLRGSYNFDRTNVYLFGQAQTVRLNNTRLDTDTLDVGVGYFHPVSDRVDVLGELAYIRQDFDGGFDVEGYRAGVGVKAALAPSLEGLAQLNYRDGGDLQSSWSGVLGARYAFTDQWSVNGGVEFFDDRRLDTRSYQLGARYSF